jgi:PST family polysaccharide transporter
MVRRMPSPHRPGAGLDRADAPDVPDVPPVVGDPGGGTGAPAGSDGRDSLLRAGAHGVAWQGLAQVVGKLVVLGTTIVLARVLVPEQFGLVSLALVLITYAEAFADAGVAQALVYLPRTRAGLRAALATSLVAGVGLVLAAVAVAPALAAFFGRPDVTPIARLLALSLLTASLGALPESLLRRDLLFRRITAATIARAVVTGVVSVSLAVAGAGAWALAWGTVAGSLTYAVATWALLPQRPDLAFWRTTGADVRRVLSYGMPVALSGLLAKLIVNVDYLVVGRLLGAAALGYYTLAFRIPELAIINVFFVLSSVTFPVFSRLRHDPDRLRNAYLFSVRVYSLYGICAGVGLAVVAPVVVPAVFGPQWADAVPALVPLALYAACRSVGVGANEVYKALGRPGLALSLSVVRLVVLVPALVLGAVYWGAVGVAWAQVVTSLAMAVLMQGRAARVLDLEWRRLVGAVVPGLVAGAAVLAVGLPLVRVDLPAAVVLPGAVLACGAAALGVTALVQRPLLRDLLQVLRRRAAGVA